MQLRIHIQRLSVEHKSLFDDFLKDVVNIDQSRLNSLNTSISAIQKYILESDYGTMSTAA